MRNRLKAVIIDKGYKSVFHFCDEHKLNYRQINRIANNEVKSINTEVITDVCNLLECDISELFYIKK